MSPTLRGGEGRGGEDKQWQLFFTWSGREKKKRENQKYPQRGKKEEKKGRGNGDRGFIQHQVRLGKKVKTGLPRRRIGLGLKSISPKPYKVKKGKKGSKGKEKEKRRRRRGHFYILRRPFSFSRKKKEERCGKKAWEETFTKTRKTRGKKKKGKKERSTTPIPPSLPLSNLS